MGGSELRFFMNFTTSPPVRKLILAALVFLAVAGGSWLFGDFEDLEFKLFGRDFEIAQSVPEAILGILWWIALAWLTLRALDVFLWDRLVAPALGGHVPRLLKELGMCLIVFLAILAILNRVFGAPLTGVLTTTGALGIVIGLAMQNMIRDFFQGIVLNIDRPFRMGQYIRLYQRGLPEKVGCVEEINWRATRIRTRDGTMLILPNHVIAALMIENLEEPIRESRFKMDFCLNFGTPPDRAIRVLTGAVKAVDGVVTRSAKARLVGVGERGAEYRIYFWINPEEFGPNKARHAVLKSVLTHLRLAGLRLAYPRQDVHLSRRQSRRLDLSQDKETILADVSIFQTLSENEIQTLSEHTIEKPFRAGSDIVSAGDEGNSMFVLVEGLLEVSVPSEEEEGGTVIVGAIEPGQFFGEMSLLTGEQRSATVSAPTEVFAYEIPKKAMAIILEQRPALAEDLAKVVVERQQLTQDARDREAKDQTSDAPTQNLAQAVLGKITRFFGV